MRIAVVGTGYVGLVVGTCLAETGHNVVCVDVDKKKIDSLKRGVLPIYEPGLEELVLRNVEEERLTFTTDLAGAVKHALVVFIAVGTPPREDGSADLTHVLDVAASICRAMEGYKVIVNKSTVPVGTARQVCDVVAEVTHEQFDIVSNPEFLKEGAAVEDFMKPDRIIIGTDDVRVCELMKELYSPFVRTGRPIMVMDPESAELSKYAANAMLAIRISFMNEMANLCERIGADVERVRECIGADNRIGMAFLFPGVGYGGSCFPKDVRAIINFGQDSDFELTILKAAHEVNEQQKRLLVQKIANHFGDDLSGLTFAVWGLAFKPKTDDMREAPSLVIVKELLDKGATVRAYDPVAGKEANRRFGDRIELCTRSYHVLDGADALVLLTEWSEFRTPDFEQMKSLMREPVVFDGRNVFERTTMARHGFTYYAIGRPQKQPRNAAENKG